MGKESANKAASYTSIRLDGQWRLREYADLTEQWSTTKGGSRHIFIEKMEACSSGWRVVSRKPPPEQNFTNCPPVISGPHDTLEGAKVAYLIALAALT